MVTLFKIFTVFGVTIVLYVLTLHVRKNEMRGVRYIPLPFLCQERCIVPRQSPLPIIKYFYMINSPTLIIFTAVQNLIIAIKMQMCKKLPISP
jgi:hypothetical protein